MENNGRRLGWVAIAIGVVALVVALTGRAGSFGAGRFAAHQYGQSYAQPYQSGPNVAPQVPVAPQAPAGPRGKAGPDARDHGHNFRGGAMPGHGGFGFFFWPFRILGGLVRLLFWGLLIFLVIKLFQRRGWGGPRGGGRGPQGPHNGPTPPSEQPPYTGETQSF